LKGLTPGKRDRRVLVDHTTLDDAGVFLHGKGEALVQTVDFFTPVVDDPFDYGQIAAANALSDVYAMGATPLTALAVLCYPDAELPPEVLREILRGGEAKMREAGVSVLGGHSVRDPELKFGYAVTGVAQRRKLLSNADARPGDRIVLTKPLGTGILSTALKHGHLDAPSEQGLGMMHEVTGLLVHASREQVRLLHEDDRDLGRPVLEGLHEERPAPSPSVGRCC